MSRTYMATTTIPGNRNCIELIGERQQVLLAAAELLHVPVDRVVLRCLEEW